ncbi:MAG: hypothetical protein M1834_009488 [Cirrosporium novae-zelandiae]|nr:MAG: hypothetical protein M1834_009488 [Cirrosporium novae-zelandiae]
MSIASSIPDDRTCSIRSDSPEPWPEYFETASFSSVSSTSFNYRHNYPPQTEADRQNCQAQLDQEIQALEAYCSQRLLEVDALMSISTLQTNYRCPVLSEAEFADLEGRLERARRVVDAIGKQRERLASAFGVLAELKFKRKMLELEDEQWRRDHWRSADLIEDKSDDGMEMEMERERQRDTPIGMVEHQ